ncbi:hypothetical protein NQ318_004627, partial [Aromia moschata]
SLITYLKSRNNFDLMTAVNKLSNFTKNSTRERAIAIRAQDEELILNTIEDEPHISTRNLSRQSGISQTSVHRVIRRNLPHPYHIQKVQELLPEDLVKRVTFCQFITFIYYIKTFIFKRKFSLLMKLVSPADVLQIYITMET